MDSSGFSKGYGFIRFGNEQEQQTALISMMGISGLGDKPLKVKCQRYKYSFNFPFCNLIFSLQIKYFCRILFVSVFSAKISPVKKYKIFFFVNFSANTIPYCHDIFGEKQPRQKYGLSDYYFLFFLR